MTDLSAISIVLPQQLTLADDRYRHLCAAMEAVRIKHNTRAGDMSAEAIGYRDECRRTTTAIIGEVLKLRPSIRAKDWVAKDLDDMEPNQPRLKMEGYADYQAVNLREITGIDFDTLKVLGEIPPDPLEDFTGYTETDPDSELTVTATSIDTVLMDNAGAVYVAVDKGAGHFGNEFTHYFTATAKSKSGSDPLFCVWGLSNSDAVWHDANNWSDGMLIYWRTTPTTFRLSTYSRATEDISSAITLAVPYWLTATRSNAGLTMTALIYTDAPKTSLHDTIAIAVSSTAYRYIYPFSNWNHGDTARKGATTVENLDLNEVPPQSQCPRTMHQFRMRRSG